MNKKNEQFDDVLEKALLLQERGKKLEEILAMFPENKNELAEILSSVFIFENAKNIIVAPRALLEKIVAEIKPVTISAEQRYYKQGVGRLSLLNNLLNFMNWKVIAPAGIIAIALAVFALVQVQPGENKAKLEIAKQTPAVNQSVQTKDLSSVTESESVDSIIDSILVDSEIDLIALADEDADISLLENDLQEINNFNQIYDENEF